MAEKQIRQVGFAKLAKKRLAEQYPDLAARMTDEEFDAMFTNCFELLGEMLRDGYRIIFEGYFSFFTKPIKRKCKNLHTGEEWWTFKRRIRVKPMDYMKTVGEVDITEEEYLAYVQHSKDKKIPAGK